MLQWKLPAASPRSAPAHARQERWLGAVAGDAWARFIQTNPNPPPPEVIYLHAGELIFRFELTGEVVPYYRR